MEETVNASFQDCGISGFLVHTHSSIWSVLNLHKDNRKSYQRMYEKFGTCYITTKALLRCIWKRKYSHIVIEHLNHRVIVFECKMAYKWTSVIQHSAITPLSCLTTCCWNFIQINLHLSLTLSWSFHLQFLCILTRYNLVVKWGWAKQARLETFILMDLWAEKHTKSHTRLTK